MLGFLPDASVSHTEQLLGRGASGIVRLGTWQPAGAGEPVEVAIKELGAGASAREEQAFVKEFRLSFEASQRCPGACRMYGCVHRADGAFCLVMKRYQGSLAHMLEERRDPSDDSRRALRILGVPPLPVVYSSAEDMPTARKQRELSDFVLLRVMRAAAPRTRV